jgi:hypothetical protein
MTVALSGSGSKNDFGDVPLRLSRLYRRSLATSVPAKVAGLVAPAVWPGVLARRLWGDCGFRRSDRRRRRREWLRGTKPESIAVTTKQYEDETQLIAKG